MRIEQLHSLTDRQVEDIQTLMQELAPDIPVSAEMLHRTVGAEQRVTNVYQIRFKVQG